MSDRSQTKGYSADSPFVRLLATPSRVKILDVLLRRHASELTASEISEQAGIDEGTFSRNKDLFEDLGIVESRKEGRTTYYRLNTDSSIVEGFGNAHSELLAHARALINETDRPDRNDIEQMYRFLTDQPARESQTSVSDVFDKIDA